MIPLGLDIYAYTREAEEAHEAHEKKWDSDNEETGFHTWDEAKRKQYWDEQSALPGHVSVPSTRFPDNINERRYLRSSYNAAGFNRYVPEVTGDERFSYYGIFEPLGNLEEYDIKVEDTFRLEECRKRARECVDALRALKGAKTYRVDSERAVSLRPDLTDGPMDASKALEMFKQQQAQHAGAKHSWGGSYGNAFGTFHLEEPMKVAAAIPGIDILGSPCMHLVYESEFHTSYLESAEVLLEFIDELEMLVKRDGCAYIHWSG